MNKLTGRQRCTLTIIWLKGYKHMNRETFIKKVCKEKNIEYSPPIDRQRNRRQTVES